MDKLILFLATGFGVGNFAVNCSSSFLNKFPNLDRRWSGSGLLGTVLGLGMVLLGFPVEGWQGFSAIFFTTCLGLFVAEHGRIIWMLQQSVIKHIQIFQRSYYPHDNVLMISVEFGMANQFIRELSANTKRGLRSRAQNGWIPHRAPVGYLNYPNNDSKLPPICKDKERFNLVRLLWDTLLKTRCTVESLYLKSKKMGLTYSNGTIISRSKFHEIFKNQFYYGYFKWGDEIYPGKHEPMISKTEFDLAQEIISGKRPHPYNQHIFAFTGMIRCPCGAAITAETKTKRQKNGNVHNYTYYRCSRRINPNCSEPPIRDSKLEVQILNLLDQIMIPPEFHQWAMKYLKEEMVKEQADRESIQQSQRRRLDACQKQLEVLLEMRMNGELSADEYIAKKEKLLAERQKIDELLSDTRNRSDTWLDRAEKLFDFAEKAKQRFEEGDLQTKREILNCLGTDLILSVRTLQLSTRKPLIYIKEIAPEVQALHRRLEPINRPENRMNLEVLYAQNPAWGPQQDNIGTFLMDPEAIHNVNSRLDIFKVKK